MGRIMMRKISIFFLAIFLMLGFVACGKSESIKLSIESVATVEVGTSVVLEPTIEGGSAEDIEWSTENAALATVSGGVVTGVAPGTVKITAKLGEVSAVCEVTVKAAVTISMDPVSKQMVEGNTAKLIAVIAGSDKAAEWSSGNTDIATVDDEGTVTAIKAGTVRITATVEGKSAYCDITVLGVSVALDKTEMTLYLGVSEGQLTASVENAAAEDVVWTTGDAKIATVDDAGTVTAVAEGTTTVTASVAGKSAVCNLTVLLPTVQLEEKATVYMTKSIRLTADIGECGGAVVWTSKNTDVATIASDGTVTPVKVGTATIEASIGAVKDTLELTVKAVPVLSLNHTEFCLDKGGVTDSNSVQLVLTADGMEAENVGWSSDNTAVVGVSNGNVQAAGAGTATISADFNGFSATCKITVKDYTGYTLVRTANQFDKALHPKGTNTVTENIVLGNDIDMGGKCLSYNPYNLNATIDGNGYSVSNFIVGNASLRDFVDWDEWSNLSKGLFWDILAGGTIKNIAFTDVTAYFAGNCGVLAIKNLGTIENVYMEVELNNRGWATEKVGGLVGTQAQGIIRNCIVIASAYTKAEMEAKTLAELGTATAAGAFCEGYDGDDVPDGGRRSQGLLVGRLDGGKVEHCYAASVDSDPTIDIFAGNLFGTKFNQGTDCALKTKEELKQSALYEGWNREIWRIENGSLPGLKNDGKAAPAIVEFLEFNDLFTDNQAHVTAVVNREEAIVYESKDTSVATVAADGTITAKKPGKVKIIASAAGTSAEIEIEIPFVFDDVSERRIKEEERLALGYEVLDPDAEIVWTVDDENKAMIEDGILVGKGEGAFVVTVVVNGKTVKLTCLTAYKVKILLNLQQADLYEGDTVTLEAEVENADASSVAWYSSNEGVATVKNGVVTAVASGTAEITAMVDGKTAVCIVTVKKVPQFSLDADYKILDMAELVSAKTFTLTVTNQGEGALPAIVWTSSDDSVATVENGVVTAVSASRAIIRATADGAFKECIVSVKNYEGYIAVSDAAGFKAIKNDCTARYVLTRDISLNGEHLSSLGVLSGILDGNGHTVSDFILGAKNLDEWLSLKEYSWEQKLWQGLFSDITGGTVKNIALKGVTAFFSNNCGVVAASNFGTIENVLIEVSLYNRGWATANVGGIAGVNGSYEGNTGTIRNCIVVASSKTNEEMAAWIKQETGKDDAKRGFCEGYDGDDLPNDGKRSQGILVGRMDGGATAENCFAVSVDSDPNLDIFGGNLFGTNSTPSNACALTTTENLAGTDIYGNTWDRTIWKFEEGCLPALRN